MNAKEFTWQEGKPVKPGKYIFRQMDALGSLRDLPQMELFHALMYPTAYKWQIVEVVKDKDNGWLTWLDEQGVNRVCNTFSELDKDSSRWFAEIPE